MTILDINGHVFKQVKSVDKVNFNFWSVQIDVSELIDGLYFLQFVDSHGRLLKTEKFVKI